MVLGDAGSGNFGRRPGSRLVCIMRLQDQLQNSWENKIGTSPRGPDLACLVITHERKRNCTVFKFSLSFCEFRVHLKLHTIEPSHYRSCQTIVFCT